MKTISTAAEYQASATEDDIQASIVETLQWYGFTVLVTSRRRKRCWKCGQWPTGGDGVTQGVPDLLVGWKGKPVWLGMEVKKADGRKSPAQKDLHCEKQIVVVRSVDDAVKKAEAFLHVSVVR